MRLYTTFLIVISVSNLKRPSLSYQVPAAVSSLQSSIFVLQVLLQNMPEELAETVLPQT